MVDVCIGVDASDLIRARRELEKRHVPFALASTLTAVAQDAQQAVRRNVRASFKLRNTWTEQGVKIKAATPSNLQAVVYTDTANRATGAPDYLVKQEDGGERVPVNGRQHIAVPTRYLRAMAPGVIPAELRPRNLLGATGGRYAGRNRKGQIAIKNQRIVRGMVFFVQDLKNGHKAIFGRLATGRDAAPFYLLVDEVRIKKSGLQMVATVQRIVRERLERQWDIAWKRIYDRGLKL